MDFKKLVKVLKIIAEEISISNELKLLELEHTNNILCAEEIESNLKKIKNKHYDIRQKYDSI